MHLFTVKLKSFDGTVPQDFQTMYFPTAWRLLDGGENSALVNSLNLFSFLHQDCTSLTGTTGHFYNLKIKDYVKSTYAAALTNDH